MYLPSNPLGAGVAVRAGVAPVVWVASYPRSGNTFLRTVLHQCFGLKSGSVYADDFGGSQAVEDVVGHIEWAENGTIEFGDAPIKLMKTHWQQPPDLRPAIYVIRDGRDAIASLFQFWNERQALTDIIDGRNDFGSWADHVTAWAPKDRPNTLLLRYEDLVGSLGTCIDQIAGFLNLDPKCRALPSRAELASIDGRWIKPENKRAPLDGPLLQRFREVNGNVMQEFGYW